MANPTITPGEVGPLAWCHLDSPFLTKLPAELRIQVH